MTLFFERALVGGEFRDRVRITCAGGVIATVEPDSRAEPGDELCGYAVPGMPNVHSHAFQKGMAGLSERRGRPRRQLLELARGDVPLPSTACRRTTWRR